jgi:hypothetical protein
MRCLYQKDERALPGNLQNQKYRFFLSSSKCSVSDYFPHFSLSLSQEETVGREPPFREVLSTEEEQ